MIVVMAVLLLSRGVDIHTTGVILTHRMHKIKIFHQWKIGSGVMWSVTRRGVAWLTYPSAVYRSRRWNVVPG
jgi:hypothetical protein